MTAALRDADGMRVSENRAAADENAKKIVAAMKAGLPPPGRE